jgi:hypothetical protein
MSFIAAAEFVFVDTVKRKQADFLPPPVQHAHYRETPGPMLGDPGACFGVDHQTLADAGDRDDDNRLSRSLQGEAVSGGAPCA